MTATASTILASLAFATLAPARTLPPNRPAPPDERFGVMTHFAHGWNPDWIPLASSISVTQVRDELYWAAIERTRGVYSFPAEYDRYMADLSAQRIAPLIVLSFENPLYDDGDTPYSDEAIAAFARYAVAVVRHYGRQIKALEVWNEFNGSFAHGPATEDRAQAYLRLLRATYRAVKDERPDILIVGGATSGVPLPYWKKLIDGGALASLDVVSVHPYRYDFPPEGIERDVDDLRALMRTATANPLPPIWATEIGWFTKGSAAPGDLAIDDARQAQYLIRACALLLSAQVERSYWYLLRDYQGLAMGLFADENKKRALKPAARAYATMVSQLRGARFQRRILTRPDFYALTFSTPAAEDVHIVWSLTPTTISTRDVTDGWDDQGRALEPVDHLEVGEAPVFLRGRLAGLPPAEGSRDVVTDSQRDFSSAQGREGWSYGALPQGESTLRMLPTFSASDWGTSWGGAYSYLSLSSSGQHPSRDGAMPVAAVRRWQSSYNGQVRVTGSFRCGTQGDGVGVSVSVDGQVRFRKLIGGEPGRTIEEKFELSEKVHPGTVIDFSVDPGPAANIDFDATTLAVVITKEGS